MTNRSFIMGPDRIVGFLCALVVATLLAFPRVAGAQENEARAPEPIGTTDEGLLQLHVRDLELATVLRMLSLQSRQNIIASPGVSGTVTADLHGVTFEEALDAVLRSQGLHAVTDKNFVYVITQEEYDQLAGADQKIQTQVFKLYYLSATEAYQLITPLLSPDGRAAQTSTSEAGVASSPENAGGDNLALRDCLVVTDYPENLADITRVLKELDVRPQQVLIEATILRAQLRDQNELGIDFTMLGGVDFERIGATTSGGNQVQIGFGPVPAAEYQSGLVTVDTDFATQVSAGGLSFSIIKDNVSVFIRALEQVTDVTVMANPKMLALNKQRGEIIVGRRDGYLTTTVTETAAIQTVEFLETGTQLIFRPFVGNDGFVRMELHPEDSSGGLTSANLPFEETTEVTTNVLLKDGHTILIGGLFRERTTAGRAQIPFLGSIPGLGLLFQRINDESAREEVIILLTVHIIKHTPEEDAQFDELTESVERIRAGARRRVLGIGRERLAQTHYQWAVEHLRRGDLSKALWDVRLALHHHTRMMPAMKLEERIRQQRIWDEESTYMRTFIHELIDQNGPGGKPYYGRPDALHDPNLPDRALGQETTDESGEEP